MRKFFRIIVCIAMIVLLLPVQAWGEAEYPAPTSEFYVNDFADVLSKNTEQTIINIGRQLEDKTTVQVVLVTVPTINGASLNDYSIGLATKWGIGQKGKDNGILILNAINERQVRIEVGYGLEGTIGAVRANGIINNDITPFLKAGDYDKGLLNGYIQVVNRIAESEGVSVDIGDADNGYYSNETRKNNPPVQSRQRNRNGFAPILVVIFLVIDGIFFRFRITSMLLRIFIWSNIMRGGRGGRGGWGGGSGGGSSGGGGSFGGGGSSGKY